jgi:hypothetical protein
MSGTQRRYFNALKRWAAPQIYRLKNNEKGGCNDLHAMGEDDFFIILKLPVGPCILTGTIEFFPCSFRILVTRIVNMICA